jgi:hypothetical protein
MPDTPPPTRPTIRLKLAALSTVGMAMVALPLAQVLRYQDAELQAALQQQAALDPMARAVAAQRALLSHRDAAGDVLRGRVALEPERRARQREVDEQVARLAGAPAVLAESRALAETTALRDDWTLLARQVGQRELTAPESDLGHRLLVEQTLQLIDLVADASGLGTGGDAETAWLASLATHGLPRLTAGIATLEPVGVDVHAGPRRGAAAEAALARALQRLTQGLEAAPRPQPLLAAAVADAHAAATRYFERRREDPEADARSARQAALQAQARLHDAARVALAASIAGRIADARLARDVLLALMAALALLALALARSAFVAPVPQATPRRAPTVPLYDALGDARVEGHRADDRRAGSRRRNASDDETSRLLQRLRQSPGRGTSRRRSDWQAETRPPDEP